MNDPSPKTYESNHPPPPLTKIEADLRVKQLKDSGIIGKTFQHVAADKLLVIVTRVFYEHHPYYNDEKAWIVSIQFKLADSETTVTIYCKDFEKEYQPAG